MTPDLLISAAILSGAVLLVVLTVVVAYREGKRIGDPSRSEVFEDLPGRMTLANTTWSVLLDDLADDGHTIQRQARLQFRQFGSRVIGEGTDDAGHRWTVEGSVMQRRLCCLFHRQQPHHTEQLGSALVEMAPSGNEMNGLRTAWPSSGESFSVQRIHLSRMTG